MTAFILCESRCVLASIIHAGHAVAILHNVCFDGAVYSFEFALDQRELPAYVIQLMVTSNC